MTVQEHCERSRLASSYLRRKQDATIMRQAQVAQYAVRGAMTCLALLPLVWVGVR